MDLYYTYKPLIKIKFPNKIGISYVLMETFVYKIFSKMDKIERILDIGGFIGESAIYLANNNNKEIYCYELSKKNFAYLEMNCKNIKNIKYYNAGVTTLNTKYVEYEESLDIDSTIKVQSKFARKMIKVKNINIINLVENAFFDGLKLDVEGGEYKIVKSLIDNKLFNFKKGIIEFHDLDNKKNLNYLKLFIDYLTKKKYKYNLITNENKKVFLSDLSLLKFCNIYFESILLVK